MKTYSYDEAFQASLDYFKGDELAARVWVNKYAMKDSFGVGAKKRIIFLYCARLFVTLQRFMCEHYLKGNLTTT